MEELVQLAQSGSAEATQELWTHIEPLVQKLVLNAPADVRPDMVQEAYLLFRETVDVYDASRGAKFTTALYWRLRRLTTYSLTERLPHGVRKVPLTPPADHDGTPEFEAYELWDRVKDNLTPHEQLVVELKVFQGMSTREIGVELDYSHNWVAQVWRQARTKLQEPLDRASIEDGIFPAGFWN